MSREYQKSPQQIESEKVTVAAYRRDLWISPAFYVLTLLTYVLPRAFGWMYPAARGCELALAALVVAAAIALQRLRRANWVTWVTSALFCALPATGMLTIAFPGRSFEATLDRAMAEGANYARLTDVEPDPSRTLGWTHETQTRQARDASHPSAVERDYRPYRSSSSHRYHAFALVHKGGSDPLVRRPIRAWLLCEVLPSRSCGEEIFRFNGSVRRITSAPVVAWLSERGVGYSVWEPLVSVESITRETSQRAIRGFHAALIVLYGFLLLRFARARRATRTSTFRS